MSITEPNARFFTFSPLRRSFIKEPGTKKPYKPTYSRCVSCVSGTDDIGTYVIHLQYEPPHDKTNKMTFVPREVSDQPGASTQFDQSSLSA